MSKSEDLRDILYNEFTNLTIFMRMLKYTVARQKMIKCFSVSNTLTHEYNKIRSLFTNAMRSVGLNSFVCCLFWLMTLFFW